MSEKRYLVIIAAAVLLLLSVPYLVGFQTSTSEVEFGGFLINPVDGHSYLAKMRQGYSGDWKFRLPYTAEPGEGAYLFLFYLGLGHVARIVNLPLIYVFHGARMISALFLILVMARMMRTLFTDSRDYRLGVILGALGSGLGWLAVLSGLFTSDFWVAEAFPFLSMYTNPHFTLGLGIMIYTLLPEQREKPIAALAAGAMLGIIQPFAVVIVSLVLAARSGLKMIQDRPDLAALGKSRWAWTTLAFGFAGGLVLIYQYRAILVDPVLSQWHQQNITPGPSLLDLVLSLSPCLLLAMIGLGKAWQSEAGRSLVIWALTSLALVFLPWSLQRRFMSGIYFPLAVLSVFGLKVLVEKTGIKFRYWVIALLFLAVPTNLIVITSGIQAISRNDPTIFIRSDLADGLRWIEENAGEEDLILADQSAGLFIPSFTGRRVIYGHPFETVEADQARELIANIYFGEGSASLYTKVLESQEVDFVILDGDSGEDFASWVEGNLDPVYRSGQVSIYSGQR